MTHQPQEGKYPSEEVRAAWGQEYLASLKPGQIPDGKDCQDFLLRKACSWQREKDARICEALVARECRANCDMCQQSKMCAHAIRHGSQEHE